MLRRILAAGALVALVAIDYALVAVTFFDKPQPAEWLLGIGLVAFAVAVVLRLRWLILVVQGVIAAVVAYRLAYQPERQVIQTSASDIGSLLFMIGLLLLAFVLARLVARALPREPWFSQSSADHSAAGK
jgi:hypothetical protein